MLPEPAWWYREAATPLARSLSPVAHLWSSIAEARYRRGAGLRAGVPVVCIGNLTAGGTGKTPLALLIGEELDRLGARPAFLTRGYGGRRKGPHWVAPGHDLAADVGDEPLLLARVAPTMVCRDRAAGGRSIIATGAGHGSIVMDDGLQNGALAKDLVIAVVDGRRGIGNGLVMPAGPLRASLAFQLDLVDAVLVNALHGAEQEDSSFTHWLRDHFGGPVLRATTRPAGSTEWIAEAPVLAFSGIGGPQRFFALLAELGARLIACRSFADHHAFTDAEGGRLLREAGRTGATLCTTEKDWVRLPETGVLGELKSAAKVLKVRLDPIERDRVRLKSLIEGLLAVRGPASA